jgi:predicted ATPase
MSRGRTRYRRQNSKSLLDIKNLSTGLKTFVILKTLLSNGALEENGVLILDEPEIHLHPAWQILFAELIVLLQKDFCMHVLLNTHSPYFLHAIEVYAAKYGTADRCKYYLATTDSSHADIADVTSDIEQIYQKLASPLQILEDERYRDD